MTAGTYDTDERLASQVSDQEVLEQQLDSFDAREREEALERLAALRLPAPEDTDNLNMHFHSFFSYNAEGWSPSHIAWRAHRAGLYAAGLCDFDVLDGLEEFLGAGELLGLRVAVNLETRVFVKDQAAVDITSPGEPGVTYIMGAGFAAQPAEGTPQAEGLNALREGARARNLALLDRINPHLPDIALDYAADVLPLTPLGVATERHIIRAYVNKSRAVFGTPQRVAEFWAKVLDKDAADVQEALDTPALEEMVRSRLVKRGGLGYAQPSEDTFPPVDEFIRWVLSCEAIPMITWLDGTSEGERDPHALLEGMTAKGCAAINIIPDRNWNYADPQERETKAKNLDAIVRAADDMGLPINIGTEMNRAGLPFVDDLSGPVLRRYRETFLRGARIMVGHTILRRFAGLSYATCDWHPGRRNAFFEAVGGLAPLTRPVAERLRELGPEGALAALEEAVERGGWRPTG